MKREVEKMKKGLIDGSIDPIKLAGMESIARRDFLAQFVGEENAKQVNSLFESKLLLKNQKAGMIAWAKQVVGITPKVRQDMLAKIERVTEVLSPKEGEVFKQDLVSSRLNLEVSQEDVQKIVDLTKDMQEKRAKVKEDFTFPTEEDRLAYGLAQVNLENYVNELKLQAKSISFRETPMKKIGAIVSEAPGVMKSLLASLDNSLWGRQGIKTLYDIRTSTIWAKNFLKSWTDITRELVGKDALALVKADIYSRPNGLNGKYRAGKYGLDVLTEEAFPSSFPERIPVLGRLFKASESAYKGGALRLRADLADRLIKMAEKNGVNTLNKEEAEPIGRLVSSLTGRGNIGTFEGASKAINNYFFSIKFLKSNFDTLTAHRGILGIGADAKVMSSPFARKESAKSTLNIVVSLAIILGLTKAISPDNVELDSRSSNFGKVKIFGKWVDITGGMAGLVTLASRLVPTLHNGELGVWTRSSSGEYKNLLGGKFGQQTPLDVLESFLEGKLSPVAGIFRDVLKGQNFQGQKPTPLNILEGATTPLSIQNFMQLMKDPNASFPLGSLILDGLGFGVSSSIPPNIKSEYFKEDVSMDEKTFIERVSLVAQAMGTDPETAFNRIFTGQTIERVRNGMIIVKRAPKADSQNLKAKDGKKNTTWKLDHTIPIELGGEDILGSMKNKKLVTTAEWARYTPVELALIKASKTDKFKIKDLQNMVVAFKEGKITKEQISKNIGIPIK